MARTAIVQSSEHGDSFRYKLASPPKSRISFSPSEAVKSFRLAGDGVRYRVGTHLHREFIKREVQSKIYICKWLSSKELLVLSVLLLLVLGVLLLSVSFTLPQEHVGELPINIENE